MHPEPQRLVQNKALFASVDEQPLFSWVFINTALPALIVTPSSLLPLEYQKSNILGLYILKAPS